MLSPKLQSQHSTHKSGFGHVTQPPGTREYLTQPRDTLQSIAVAFDTTTTKLMKLNKMSSLTIFPGQELFVPHNEAVQSFSSHENNAVNQRSDMQGDFSFLSPLTPSSLEREFKDLAMVSSKPKSAAEGGSFDIMDEVGEKRRQFASSESRHVLKHSISQSSEDRRRIMSGESTESEPFEEGFLKMIVSYMNDRDELVAGTLLVTPSALMFDPDTTDAIVKRDGCDSYGIMCPMPRITRIAMYNDTRRKQASVPIGERLQCDVASEVQTRHSRGSSTSSDTTTEAETKFDDDDQDVPDLPLDAVTSTPSSPTKQQFTASNNGNTLYEIKNPVPGSAKLATAVRGEDVERAGDCDGAAGDDERTSHKLEDEFPFLQAKTVQDWIPTYSDWTGNKSETIQHFRPDCNHMYLCINSLQKMVRTFSVSEDENCNNSSCNARPAPDQKYPEYWFRVPRKKSDLLYAFFLQWSPENRGDLASEMGFVVTEEETDSPDGNAGSVPVCSQEATAIKKKMRPIDNNSNAEDANANKKKLCKIANSSLEFVDDFFDESYSFEKEWEIISIQEAKRRSIAFNAIELAEADDSLIPEMKKPSALLNDTTLLSLCKSLPNRCIGYTWYPVYTTADHGTSLKTLYRNMGDCDAPVVLIVQDTSDYIFGALLSDAPKVSDHYYGTGESFLFTIEPEFQVFKWTGENNFFLKGNVDSLTMGGGKGSFGLWLDSDLRRGSTRPCDTFGNKVLASQEDFVIQSVEVWMIKD